MDTNAYTNNPESNPPIVELPPDYKPNPEELKLLAQCRNEGTMKGIVFGFLFGGGTYQTIKYFNMQPHPRFGHYLRVGGSAFFGYMLGKILAIPMCYQKFKSLPNSPIGEYMRQKNSGIMQGFPMESVPDASFATSAPSDTYNNNQMNSALDMDIYRSVDDTDSHIGNDWNSPSADLDDEVSKEQKPLVSYAELRQRNRAQYGQPETQRYVASPPAAQPTQSPVELRRPVPGAEKTKYGDVWG